MSTAFGRWLPKEKLAVTPRSFTDQGRNAPPNPDDHPRPFEDVQDSLPAHTEGAILGVAHVAYQITFVVGAVQADVCASDRLLSNLQACQLDGSARLDAGRLPCRNQQPVVEFPD